MGRRTLEHRQLPLRTTLVEAQNVQIAVVAFDLEVAIVWSIPPIDVFDDFDLARIEPKAHRHFHAEMASTMLDLYLHNFLLPRMFSRRCPIIGLLSGVSLSFSDRRRTRRDRRG
jgi:hypothetical protein